MITYNDKSVFHKKFEQTAAIGETLKHGIHLHNGISKVRTCEELSCVKYLVNVEKDKQQNERVWGEGCKCEKQVTNILTPYSSTSIHRVVPFCLIEKDFCKDNMQLFKIDFIVF